MTIRGWVATAGWLLVGGAVAWLAKIAVIVAHDSHDLDRGAAAWLMRLGLVGLVTGATGVGLWLARRGSWPVRIAAVLLAPVVLAASLVALGSLAASAVGSRGPAYAREEGGIVLAAAIWLAVGVWLLVRVRRATSPVSTVQAARAA